MRLGGLSSEKLAWMASSCHIVDVEFVVSRERSSSSKKIVPMMTLQQVRECLSGVLVEERLRACSQDEYICFRCTQWLNRTKLAVEYCKNMKNDFISSLFAITWGKSIQ